VDSPISIAPFVTPSAVKYDSLRDLAPIGLINAAPMILLARPGLPADSFAELVKLARAQPGKLSYATSGVGTVLHLAMERVKQQAGIDVLHVPY
jgi:tripartite-type tricarboxylate transporter receptor subunit TctC